MGMDSPARPDERKIVTVLFADLVGSTALADEVDPERTRGLLERFYALTSAELETAGGTLEKFAGDAVMAVFGSPVAQEDHAQRALHAALRIRDEVVRRFEGRLGVRLGINSGEVLVSAARAGSAFVSGDAVNVAARLEQAAAPGQILVGARTAANARAAFTFGPVVQLEVRGKHEPVAAQELLHAEARDASRARGALGTTFVGRQLELGHMRATWERVATNREPQLVTLIGEPGIGKTSTLQRMLGWLGEQAASPIVRSGRCLAYGQGSTYWPLAQVLHEHLGISRTATDQEVLDLLGDRRILGLTFGLPVADDLHPLAARERHHDAWIALLDEVAARSPGRTERSRPP